jgi:predicted Holliday junction resolvase-like endonuclease
LILVVLLFVGVLLLNLTQAAKIKHLENKIAKKEAQLEKDESSDGYKKFLAVKSLESKTS